MGRRLLGGKRHRLRCISHAMHQDLQARNPKTADAGVAAKVSVGRTTCRLGRSRDPAWPEAGETVWQLAEVQYSLAKESATLPLSATKEIAKPRAKDLVFSFQRQHLLFTCQDPNQWRYLVTV